MDSEFINQVATHQHKNATCLKYIPMLKGTLRNQASNFAKWESTTLAPEKQLLLFSHNINGMWVIWL